MPSQTLHNLEIRDDNHHLTLCLHNGNLENIKNAIESNEITNYISSRNLVNNNFRFHDNIIISDTFIMVDLRTNKFTYNNYSYLNTFKDSFVNNKFYNNDKFPIFFIKDLFIDVTNTQSTNFVARNIEKLTAEIISNIM
tara:strand:+ start:428 stop:844 length:417 start_codon:yes stop_codon:yes gene_type:complete